MGKHSHRHDSDGPKVLDGYDEQKEGKHIVQYRRYSQLCTCSEVQFTTREEVGRWPASDPDS